MDYLSNINKLQNILDKPTITLKRGVIDNEILLSYEFYKKHNWKLCYIDGNYLEPIHVGFFLNALKAFKIEQLDVFHGVSRDNIKYFKTIDASCNSVASIFDFKDTIDTYELIGDFIIIIDKNLTFLVLIDPSRDGNYFYGEKEFIDLLLPIPLNAYRSLFKFYINFTKYLSPISEDFLLWLWKTYIERNEDS